MKTGMHYPTGLPFNQDVDLFRLINPNDYKQFGIDPKDVPIGTFAAEDHPGYLLSRYGGNAYGFGLVEQDKLSKADYDFIQGLDYQNREEITRHAKRLNEIYQKLGLLIRFSKTGQRYFLIPITLIAHSLQDIKAKADEIEKLVLRHIQETGTERLDIGLVRPSHDVLVHELQARLSVHRIFLLESLEKIRSWRTPLDMVIFPQDPTEYLFGQPLPKATQKVPKKRRIIQYAIYMAGKIYDILEPTGKFVILAPNTLVTNEEDYRIEFKSNRELKNFLLFTHIFKTKKKYIPNDKSLSVHPLDLCSYLNHHVFSETHLKRLLRGKKPEKISLHDIDALPYLNVRLPTHYFADPQRQWSRIFGIYFKTVQFDRKSPDYYCKYWQERLVSNKKLPDIMLIYTGQRRTPKVFLDTLEQELKQSGLMGCSLPLVADYRNSFHYVLNVLTTLTEIRDSDLPQLSKIECDRLRSPFLNSRNRYEGFNAIIRLTKQISKLKKTCVFLNPDNIEGATTPVLENLPKLSLHGFTPQQLREILLIVVGHSTMSRIVVGKLPARSLKPVTDKANDGNYQEVIELLRVCRLMSMAEIIAALGDTFTREQAQELFDLYADAVQVASNPAMDWQRLTDLRISELGGVQNKAVREMMKFFNLFEFLNNWKEYESKGPFEREVLCDYDSNKLSHLEEVMDLVNIARSFKSEIIADQVTTYSYFFRHFLESEFHGTGHLFPRLGTQVGFILLWITVNAAERRIINFNPILAGIAFDRHEQRIHKVRRALLQIPKDELTPELFEHIKKTLSEGKPAFILDTGLRLMNNPTTKAIDVSFVDVEENILQIKALLAHFESHKLRDISLKDLRDMERLFSELESYQHYLRQSNSADSADRMKDLASRKDKNRKISEINKRLKSVFQSQIFVPEEIYEIISLLASHCPEILRYILPEFHTFGSLIDYWPTRKKQSLGTYIMRCLRKYQALVTKDREAFQDRNTFYQHAKSEFGPYAEEDIGAKHIQLETLEHMADRIQQSPVLAKAFTMALLFQDIGKVAEFNEELSTETRYFTHAEQSVAVLGQYGILSKYDIDQQVQNLALRLIQYHGSVGHVIQGEEPVTALDHLCRDQDSRLADAFVLHAILAAASVEEGLMTEDLLDLFLAYRRVAHQLIKTKSSWQSWLKDELVEKGQAILADVESAPEQLPAIICNVQQPASSVQPEPQEIVLKRGQQIGALERLLRLMDVKWVDYQDIQMHLMNIPLKFIYHKKDLKSIGPATFKNQMQRSTQILQVISALQSETREFLFHMLAPLSTHLRIYDFHPLNRFLEVEECLKLILIAFEAYRRLFPTAGKSRGLISFRPLSQDIGRRFGALRDILREVMISNLSLSETGNSQDYQHRGGLHFEVDRKGRALRVGFQDAIQLDHMIRSLTELWDYEHITSHYRKLRQELKKLPYDTEDYAERLHEAFLKQCYEINNKMLNELQNCLKQITDFVTLEKIKTDRRTETMRKYLTEDQEFLIEDIFEYHLDRIRKQYLDDIYNSINSTRSARELIDYWHELKYEMLSYRTFLGKAYESLVAKLIDSRLQTLRSNL